jgi:hypothetical protein
MRGDAYDLFDLLVWADCVRGHTVTIRNQQEQAYWTPAEKKEILKAGEALFKAFKAAEKLHRVEHKINVGKTARKTVRYDLQTVAMKQGLTSQCLGAEQRRYFL